MESEAKEEVSEQLCKTNRRLIFVGVEGCGARGKRKLCVTGVEGREGKRGAVV